MGGEQRTKLKSMIPEDELKKAIFTKINNITAKGERVEVVFDENEIEKKIANDDLDETTKLFYTNFLKPRILELLNSNQNLNEALEEPPLEEVMAGLEFREKLLEAQKEEEEKLDITKIPRYLLDRSTKAVDFMPVFQIKTGIFKGNRLTPHKLIGEIRTSNAGESWIIEAGFHARNPEDAMEMGEKIKDYLVNVRHKIMCACWTLAQKNHQNFEKIATKPITLSIVELMRIYYQKDYNFSVEDKNDFYDHLKGLSNTSYILRKKLKKGTYEDVHLKAISISKATLDEEKTPESITVTLFHCEPMTALQTSRRYIELPNSYLNLNPSQTFLLVRLLTLLDQKDYQNELDIDEEILMHVSGRHKTYLYKKQTGRKRLEADLDLLVSQSYLNYKKTKFGNRWVYTFSKTKTAKNIKLN